MENLLQNWLQKTNAPFDVGNRLPVTNMLDIGQAYSTDQWLDRSPKKYADSLRKNFSKFKTGEQIEDEKPVFPW